MRTASESLHLVVVDLDGCLTRGEAQPLDFGVLERVASLNDRASKDPSRPAITLCTGRPAPYVEVVMQAIHAFVPAIYENGGGLYFPSPYSFRQNAAITPAMKEDLARLKTLLQRELVEPGLAYFQPGKEVSLTLFPGRDIGLGDLYRKASQVVPEGRFVVEETTSCLNILFRGVDKEEGVRWLSRETGVPLARMAGIGDSTSDLKFLRLVGWAAAPANASREVRKRVHYVSPYEDGEGLLDILNRLLKKGED